MRDTQKSRVYAAEDVLRGRASATARRLLLDTPRVPSTGSVTIEACQQYVDHLTQSAWFQRRWGYRHYRVRHKAYGKATCSYGSVISVPPWARDESVLLHEVAHGLVGGQCADHGPEFAGVLLALVEHRMGKDAATMLRAAYKDKRVRQNRKALPTPDERRVRSIARPVRVPSATIAAKHAAVNGQREEDKRARYHRTRGFDFGGERFPHVSALMDAIRAEQRGERGPVPREGVETTVRRVQRPVRWEAAPFTDPRFSGQFSTLTMWSGAERVHSGSWAVNPVGSHPQE